MEMKVEEFNMKMEALKFKLKIDNRKEPLALYIGHDDWGVGFIGYNNDDEYLKDAIRQIMDNQETSIKVKRIEKRHGFGCDCGFCECLRKE